MKQIRKRITYANVMSSLAVFLVLGGATAFAANNLGKNTVGAKQLKKNAVTAAKIKKNAVTAAKIKKEAVGAGKIKKGSLTSTQVKAGSITGASINLSTLGKVPSAATADNATHAANADNATNAVNATNFSRYGTSGLKKASVGSEVELASVGPFTIKGHCEDEGSGKYRAEVQITTSQAGSFMQGVTGYDEGNFEPGEEVRIGEYGLSASPEWPDYYDDDDTGWTAASPDGSFILKGLATAGVHVFGADCAYLVTWTNNA